MDGRFVKGLLPIWGGRTSHAAIIMARSLQIPAIVGCNDINNQKGAEWPTSNC